jgi:V8-like Glu-specific endopeptidase
MCLVLSTASPIGAAIFDTDDRRAVDTSVGSPYAPVGLVVGGPLYGTGTLVADCYAITSQHIFGGRESALGRRVRFIGSLGSRRLARSTGAVVVEGGLEQSVNSKDPYEIRARDWVLIKLDKCLGTSLGVATLVPNPRDEDLMHVQSAGFPMDRPRSDGLTVDPSCGIRSVRPLVWLNDCAALGGNSGGPIFRIVDAGGRQRMEVYAIQTAAVRSGNPMSFAASYANQATPAWAILPRVLSWIEPAGRNPQ